MKLYDTNNKNANCMYKNKQTVTQCLPKTVYHCCCKNKQHP